MTRRSLAPPDEAGPLCSPVFRCRTDVSNLGVKFLFWTRQEV
jgi:hypothetical protein